MLSLLLLTPTNSSTIASAQKRKGHPPNRSLNRTEMTEAEGRLAEMGYGKGRDGAIDIRSALIAFQKYEGRKVTGQREEERPVLPAGPGSLIAFLQPFQCVLADRLQQAVPSSGRALFESDEGLLDQ